MTEHYQISPSILAADFARLGEEVAAVVAAGADSIHFDVMDNHYVPNLTLGPMFCTALRRFGLQQPITVHLMVQPVDEMIKAFIEAGANTLLFHPDASVHVDRSLRLIRSSGCQAGLALNPATPFQQLEHVLDLLDEILVMSVNPGFGGQAFIHNSINKVAQLQQWLSEKSDKQINIAVDGGISAANIAALASAGARTFVAGSAIFSSTDYHHAIKRLREALTNPSSA